MPYLLRRKNNYYYNRRVPDHFRDLDPRDTVRVSLKTDSRRQAWRKAVMLNEQVEAYWQGLLTSAQKHDLKRFGKVVHVARQMGFCYLPMEAVAALPLPELVQRVLALKDATPQQVEAALGGKKEPAFTLKNALEQFWELTLDRLLNKTPDQVRKWKNPRIKAMENFIALVGNKALKNITRDDIVAFRDWWLERVRTEGKNPGSANKDFIHLKGMIEVVSDHRQAGLDVGHLFKKIKLPTRFKQRRLPFTPEQIKTILQSDKLQLLNEEARWFLFAAAGTGARPSEIVGLLPEDIRLDVSIPHIAITDRPERTLKNPHSEREIPLVGYALEAFKARPEGFPRYRDRPDSLSALLNRFLRGHKLLPSKKHSVYSFRHSFQDAILKVNAPDRIQAELMGHKFNRPKYGDGGSLKQKMEWLQKILVY